MIKENLEKVLEEIAKAATAAERAPESVQLIAVSKTKPLSEIQEAYDAGQKVFGENRVQELTEKYPNLPFAKWHMIGSLQRNKVKHIAPFISLIHSVDSPKLLKEISKQARNHSRTIDCLLQINISHEEQKSGMEAEEVAALLKDISSYPNVRILGFMGMATLTDDKKLIRSQFAALRTLRDSFLMLQNQQVLLKELSMGMSGDFEEAIAEGATMVRIGSAVFGVRG